MINMALYIHGLKSSLKTLLLFTVILVMYFLVVIWMYDPALKQSLDQFSETMPELMAAFGMNMQESTLTGFISTYLYGFMMLIFPMVSSILLANKLVASAVDRGSMAYLLASPNTRIKIAFTQAKVLASGLLLLIALTAAFGLAVSAWLFPGELELKGYLWLNVGVLLLQSFIAGFCFFASCLFNETKYCLALGAGVPCLAYLIQMLANIGDQMENLKYATFFSLYSPEKLVAGETAAYWGIAILGVGGILFFALGVIIFNKRDLPV